MRLWQKYTLALAVVALVPLAVTTWRIVDHDVAELGQAARANHLATADVALTTLRALLDQASAEARTVGAAFALEGAPPEERERSAQAQLLGARALDNFTLYTPDGELVLSYGAPRAAAAAKATPPPSLGLDARKIAETERRLLGGVERRADGAPVLPLIVPIRRADGTLYAFLWTALDLTGLSARVAELSARRYDRRTDLVRVVDDQLRVIAAADPAALWTPLAGRGPLAGVNDSAPLKHDAALVVESVRDGGEALIGALVPLPELAWGVLVEEPRDQAYAAVARTVETALLFGGLFALFAIGLGVWAARALAAPVVAVSKAAQQVAGGDFAVRVAVRGSDEVGQMAGAFNGMARDLGDYRARLIEETRVRGNLSRFLSPDVVEQVVAGEGELKLGGERREITVMFADVVKFTDMVERHPPEFVVGLLNELFTIITEIVFKHGGIIDKFIGDCAMAIWGAPKAHDDDPQRAVRAAEEILRWLEVGNAKWRRELGHDLELAIGIHTGTAVVGNLGSDKRMEYTAIGDVVNAAARLERLAQPGQILMTAQTMTHVSGEFDAQSLGDVDLAGGRHKSEIFVLED